MNRQIGHVKHGSLRPDGDHFILSANKKPLKTWGTNRHIECYRRFFNGVLPPSCAPDLADPILSFSNFQWNNRKAIAHLVRPSTARVRLLLTPVRSVSRVLLTTVPPFCGCSLTSTARSRRFRQLSSPASLYPGYFYPPHTTEKFGLQVQYGLVNDFSAMDNNVVANRAPDINSPLLAHAVVEDATSNATAAKVATLVATVAASSKTENSTSKRVNACCCLRWATINLVACCRRRQGKGDARGLR